MRSDSTYMYDYNICIIMYVCDLTVHICMYAFDSVNLHTLFMHYIRSGVHNCVWALKRCKFAVENGQRDAWYQSFSYMYISRPHEPLCPPLFSAHTRYYIPPTQTIISRPHKQLLYPAHTNYYAPPTQIIIMPRPYTC